MKRYTAKNQDGTVLVAAADMHDALCRLAAFEDAFEALIASQAAIPAELELLKAAGKEKTVRYRELFGQKLLNKQIMMFFEKYGISVEYKH